MTTLSSSSKVWIYDDGGGSTTKSTTKIPNDVSVVKIKQGVVEIKEKAFASCKNLVSIQIPDTVEYIGSKAFEDCISLKCIDLPSSLEEIDMYAFFGCHSLLSITFPPASSSTINTMTIHSNAFDSCTSLVSVDMRSSNSDLSAAWIFHNCISLNTIHFSTTTTTTIASHTFHGCKSLTSMELPSSLIQILPCAFFECSNLKSLTIPSSVTSIGQAAFYHCYSLTSIELPSSLQFIGNQVFQHCSKLTTVYLPPKIPTAVEITDGIFDDITSFHPFIKIKSTITDMNDNVVNLFKDLAKLVHRLQPTPCTLDSILPLHLLLMFGNVLSWEDGIEKLIKDSPANVEVCDPIYNMYPFCLAVFTPRMSNDDNSSKEQRFGTFQHIETLYLLLREAPWAIDTLLSKKRKRPNNV